MKEVLQDEKGFGIDTQQKVPLWFASEGGQVKYDVSDLAGLSYNIKEVLKQNAGRRIRIVTDVLSSLLMLNPPETIYRFLTQLIADIKQYDAVLLATLEEGMHQPQVLAAMEQLFDGVVEMRLYEEGLRVLPAAPRQEDARYPAAAWLLQLLTDSERNGDHPACQIASDCSSR